MRMKRDLRGIWPMLGLLALLGAADRPVSAAYTEPRLALTRIQVLRSSAGTVSLQLQGTFNFADLVQLDLPVQVFVSQGASTTRFDHSGGVFVSENGGPEAAASGPGLVALQPNRIVVVLPSGFPAGSVSVRVVIDYDGKQISTNELGVSL